MAERLPLLLSKNPFCQGLSQRQNQPYLYVALVLPDQPVQGQGVEPHGVVDVPAVLVRPGEVLLGGDDGRHLLAPVAHGLAGLHHLAVLGEGGVDQAEVALDGLVGKESFSFEPKIFSV